MRCIATNLATGPQASSAMTSLRGATAATRRDGKVSEATTGRAAEVWLVDDATLWTNGRDVHGTLIAILVDIGAAFVVMPPPSPEAPGQKSALAPSSRRVR
jgi:hypothetical protein